MSTNVAMVNAPQQLNVVNGQTALELAIDATVVLASAQDAFSDQVTHVEISCKKNAVVYTQDGSTPADDNGHGALMQSGDTVYWTKARWNVSRWVEAASGSDGIIHIQPLAL